MRLLLLFLLIIFAGCEAGNKSSVSESNVTTIDNSNNSQQGRDFFENPQCPALSSVDGPGGFLWKPKSDSDGNLVVLFPDEYQGTFLDVLAELKGGEYESGEFSGFTNGDRQTWRFSKSGSAYTGRLIVDAGSQECEWLVGDSEKVQD